MTLWRKLLLAGAFCSLGLNAVRADDAALNAAGNRAYADGKFAEALTAYDQALQIATPENRAQIQFNRANALYRLGKFAEAKEAYAAAGRDDARLDPESAYNRGNAAWQEAEKIQDSDPQTALKRLEESAALYRQAREQDPGDTDSAYNLELARRKIAALRKKLPPPQKQTQPHKTPQTDQQNQQKQQGQQGQQEQQKQQGQQGQQEQQGQQPQQKQSEPQGQQDPSSAGQNSPAPQNSENSAPKPRSGADKNVKSSPSSPQEPQPDKDKKEEARSPSAANSAQDPAQRPDQTAPVPGQKDDPKKEENGTPPSAADNASERQGKTPKTDEAARTADEILQREKADRERREKQRRRQTPVERDW